MEYIGFIKEVDKNIRSGKNILEMMNVSDIATQEKQEVINYLSNGQVFGGAMSYTRDVLDGALIGPMQYYTDGVYVWPVYYFYYIKKYENFYIPDYFLKYLKNKNFEFERLTEVELDRIDLDFTNEWSGKYKK